MLWTGRVAFSFNGLRRPVSMVSHRDKGGSVETIEMNMELLGFLEQFSIWAAIHSFHTSMWPDAPLSHTLLHERSVHVET